MQVLMVRPCPGTYVRPALTTIAGKMCTWISGRSTAGSAEAKQPLSATTEVAGPFFVQKILDAVLDDGREAVLAVVANQLTALGDNV